MKIREAKITDAKEIWEINNKSLGYDIDPETVREKLETVLGREFYKVFVCVDENDKAVGYIQLQDYETTYFESCLNVLGLAVLSEYQGRGVGKILLERAEDYARQKNFARVRVNSGAERTEAHKFYEHLGYSCHKMQKNFYKDLT
ncbi:MAG: GNAT family N-acetyltransferase [Clostridia bacterium]|nr:GNAT family N-acetyltransferase [Clostridia bacterium]